MIHPLRQLTLVLLAVGGMAAGFAGFLPRAMAAAPMQKTPSPGYYRFMLGKFEVTALHDGMLNIDSSLLQGISESDIQKLLAKGFIKDPHKIPTSTNAFLVNTGEKLYLFDTGGGKSFVPTLGNLVDNMKASGYQPDQVDDIFLTHLHPDHIGGLTDDSGKFVFPKCGVWVAALEHDFWFSEKLPQNMPADVLEHYKANRELAGRMAAPYRDKNRWVHFMHGELPLDGVKVMPVLGHTPGHTAYEVFSGNESMIILGDTLHCAAIQCPRPDPSVRFDIDPAKAVASRAALFKKLAANKTLVAGMHLPFPGIGHLRSDGPNTYTWVPIEYVTLPETTAK